MVVGVLGAQLASYVIWTTQARSSQLEQLDELSLNVAYSVASTVRFFRSLPYDYRHIVLDQLRDMGGTRFFVSVNDHRIPILDTGNGPGKSLVVDNFQRVLASELGIRDALVEFSRPEELRLLNNEVLLHDLPRRWGQHSLLMEPLSPPVLVVQMELEPETWLYVATLLPIQDLFTTQGWLSEERLLAALLVLLTVIGLSLAGIRSATLPLGRLSRAAHQLGNDLDAPPLRESGPREVVATAVAFNRMQRRIREQVEERERLFSAISHDLKTPITRLRLRAEMLDDPLQRERFCASLDELDQLVKGALASVKGVDLHEPLQEISLRDLLEGLAEELSLQGGEVAIEGNAAPLTVKPLAIKRCLANLLENAIFYGGRAEVSLDEQGTTLRIAIRDHGPGIPDAEQARVFDPFVRLEPSRSRHTGGSGLGLGIARHIVRAHGGELTLANHPRGGLVATLVLPREPGGNALQATWGPGAMG
ncbi:ATP-binding protein [Halomonas heilongjiangensis]|uniref:histidine kinase n=1 Tax=Halomonas heilongjiangensis TaxID=1387883 RepID=A0A2N7TV23_9GAMM|nr:ATP-binding protein [Halomonas heilongjiangensis]PMR72026.1 two-component sensor histidine kinase [Halomonas heilongjiangensis]PXX88038.1 two-component sensor histidine kinase [Halomonas heilongjiangensis]